MLAAEYQSGLRRTQGEITVSGGTGSVTVEKVFIKTGILAVEGPSGNETFKIEIRDLETNVLLSEFQSRSGNQGNARSKSLQTPLWSCTITIIDASADGVYTYLLMG